MLAFFPRGPSTNELTSEDGMTGSHVYICVNYLIVPNILSRVLLAQRFHPASLFFWCIGNGRVYLKTVANFRTSRGQRIDTKYDFKKDKTFLIHDSQ